MPYRLNTEYALSSMTLEAVTIGLVGDFVMLAVPFIQEDDGDGAHNREQRNDCRNPERPGVGAKVCRDNVRSRLASELGKVRDSPKSKSSSIRVALYW